MKRLFPIVAIGVLGLIGAAGAAATAEDQVTGSARAADERSVSVTAHGTPLAARGYVRFQSPVVALVTGEVDCLKVQGNRAAASGELDEPISRPPFLLTHFTLLFEDNGQPNDGPPDEFRLLIGEAFEFAGDCGFYLFDFAPLLIVTQGDLVVKDS